jgi:prevent-host-death family protein
MQQTWRVEDGSKGLNDVVQEAVRQGPQVITSCGEEVAVVLSMEEYKRLTEQKTSLVEFFRNSPMTGAELDLTRDQSLPRDDFNP